MARRPVAVWWEVSLFTDFLRIKSSFPSQSGPTKAVLLLWQPSVLWLDRGIYLFSSSLWAKFINVKTLFRLGAGRLHFHRKPNHKCFWWFYISLFCINSGRLVYFLFVTPDPTTVIFYSILASNWIV